VNQAPWPEQSHVTGRSCRVPGSAAVPLGQDSYWEGCRDPTALGTCFCTTWLRHRNKPEKSHFREAPQKVALGRGAEGFRSRVGMEGDATPSLPLCCQTP